MKVKTVFSSLILALLFCGCEKACIEIEPNIVHYPSPCLLESRPSAFEGLLAQEGRTDWGKEMRTAYAFANEQDYYRAITSFKRALVFLPPNNADRKFQIEYGIVQSYYLAGKYKEAVESFEVSSLGNTPKSFPGFRNLLIMLYESYEKIDDEIKKQAILSLIQAEYPEDAETLQLSTAFLKAEFPVISSVAENRCDADDINTFLGEYLSVTKSPRRAQIYQAILPGAGYYYVGQKKAALTSFLINSLFIWASCRFFEDGNIAAGLITASLETGWYFGGINGARLAANEYNQRAYEVNTHEFMRNHHIFPILMINTNF